MRARACAFAPKVRHLTVQGGTADEMLRSVRNGSKGARDVFDRIKKILSGGKGESTPAELQDKSFSSVEMAAAALMIEASRMDSAFDKTEREAILRIVQERFCENETEARALMEAAETKSDGVYDDWVFTEAIANELSLEERVNILQMLWEVAYADGTLHRFEQHMIKRIAFEIQVPEDRVEQARQAAMAKTGTDTSA